jgi:transcriptional regulator NrdR family protein
VCGIEILCRSALRLQKVGLRYKRISLRPAKILNGYLQYMLVVFYLVKVKKRSGATQDFDKAKLKASVKKAGAKEEHATKVADNLASKVKEGTMTVEIRRWCITELRPLDPKVAKAYETFEKPAKKK